MIVNMPAFQLLHYYCNIIALKQYIQEANDSQTVTLAAAFCLWIALFKMAHLKEESVENPPHLFNF